MERREFVSHMAGLLALSMGAEGLSGCATFGGIRHGATVDPRVVVADWDAQVTRLQAHGVPRTVRRRLQALGLSPTLIENGFGSLLVTAGFRDLPRNVQRDPIVQARLQEELPRMAEAVLSMTHYLEGLSEPDRQRVGATVRGDDSPVPELRTEIERVGRREAIAPERIDETLEMVDHIDFRLKHQDPSLLIDATVHKVDEAVEEVGGDRRHWSAAGRRSPTFRNPKDMTEQEIITTTRQLGSWTLALGGLLSLAGLVTAYASAVFGRQGVALFGVAAWLFGSMVFVMGLVIMTTAELARDVSRYRALPG